LQSEVDGTVVKPFGDNPHGYLVYTPDGHVFVQIAARERAVLLRSGQLPPTLLETTEAGTALAFLAYCGTFEVLGDQVIHHKEFDIRPNQDGSAEARSVELAGDRLILGFRTSQIEWQRVR
jgi:hypothetical protein